MRLIGVLSSKFSPESLSQYLFRHGIDNQYEPATDTVSGQTIYRVWIQDEDQVQKAENIFKLFQENPQSLQFQTQGESTEDKPIVIKKKTTDDQRIRFLSPSPYGPVSIFLLLLVIGLFFWSQASRTNVIPPDIPGVIRAPMLAPIERALLFDYPEYFRLRDQFFTLYTPQDIEEKKAPSSEASSLLQKIRKMSPWMGIYERIVAYSRDKSYPLLYQGQMFEKIARGEIWRLFTPALLHFNLIHIFFNVLWFILLGNQIEYRIGGIRYLLFVLLTGIISNVSQYLMSGPFFMGLSGIICAMAGFIWARQQVAPWEGYLLHRLTLIFLGIFIIGMFFLQLAFFFMQITGTLKTSPIPIANTAHLVGALVGYLLGRMPFFAIHHSKKILK